MPGPVRIGHSGRPLATRARPLVLFYPLLSFYVVSPSSPLDRLFILSVFRVLLDSLIFSFFCGTAADPLSLFQPSFGSSVPASDNNLSDLRSFSDPASEVPLTHSVLTVLLLLLLLFYLPPVSVSVFPKIETYRFDGKSDFVMWRRKMKAVLVQNKIAPAICSPEEYPESWKGEILKEKLYLQKENKSHGENLFVRGRIDQREPPSHRFKSRSKSREKSKVECFYCGKEVHMKNKCFKRIKDEKQRKHGK
ncbi:hypothetical protein M9H77_22515 [Catharanthus roseus]|uniref:Uncharacterized protein n=1 Tax=Catharanthus roseus TaxID=4058 RepID=A0ACC0AQB5_CATRO|nr:hypothetical protein M9H77_22515 [Catharanthus roseus]